MVCLTPRFLLLAALVATAAMPSFVLQSNARAVDANARHHHHKPSSASQSTATVMAKGKGKIAATPVLSLPTLMKGKATQDKKTKEHRKGNGKNDKRDMFASPGDSWDPLDPIIQVGNVGLGDGRGSSFSDTHHLLSGILVRDPDHHHHHHHHHERRDGEPQAVFSLNKRTVSRIYGKQSQKNDHLTDAAAAAVVSGETLDMLDPLLQIGKFQVGDGRGGSFSETHHLLSGVGKRSPHHHHDHGDHGRVIVNGDNDDVHYHDRRTIFRGRLGHHESVSNNFGSGNSFSGASNIGNINERRAPHHHHGHHDHDKVVVNGDNDDVHIHERSASNIGNINERRAPHHHHHHDHHDHNKVVVNGNDDDVHVHERRVPRHHHHHGEHDKTVINGNDDNVHVHERDNVPADDLLSVDVGLHLGDGCEVVDGHYVNCLDASSDQHKRSEAVDDMPGVPGTVDIMNVGAAMQEKLASLILSSVPDNSTTNSSSLLNGTKAASDPDTSPFILDASNTTQTQFFLVVSPPPGGSALPSGSLTDTLAALKAAASSKSASEDPQSADIQVTLQVPVFEPSEAAMRPYCATFDPNPPTPAPLTMEKCFADMKMSGNASDASMHKSQTFAYNPLSGIVRPMWFGASAGSPAGLNSTDPSSNLTDTGSASNSTSGIDEKQMNFKIPTSNKDLPVSVPVANVTQTVNGTAPSVPAGVPLPAGTSPQNVTLVFTPVGLAVHAVNDPSDVASFEPASGSDSANPSAFSSSMMSMSSDPSDAMPTDSRSTTTTSTDSSNAATPTDSDSDVPTVSPASSDATDVMSASADSTISATTVPMPAYTVDQAAIEKMYQQKHNVV